MSPCRTFLRNPRDDYPEREPFHSYQSDYDCFDVQYHPRSFDLHQPGDEHQFPKETYLYNGYLYYDCDNGVYLQEDSQLGQLLCFYLIAIFRLPVS